MGGISPERKTARPDLSPMRCYLLFNFPIQHLPRGHFPCTPSFEGPSIFFYGLCGIYPSINSFYVDRTLRSGNHNSAFRGLAPFLTDLLSCEFPLTDDSSAALARSRLSPLLYLKISFSLYCHGPARRQVFNYLFIRIRPG